MCKIRGLPKSNISCSFEVADMQILNFAIPYLYENENVHKIVLARSLGTQRECFFSIKCLENLVTLSLKLTHKIFLNHCYCSAVPEFPLVLDSWWVFVSQLKMSPISGPVLSYPLLQYISAPSPPPLPTQQGKIPLLGKNLIQERSNLNVASFNRVSDASTELVMLQQS